VTKEALHIFDERQFSLQAKLTYIVMASCIKNNVCLQSLDEISRKASLSNKRVIAAIQELVLSKFIMKQINGSYSFPYLRDGL